MKIHLHVVCSSKALAAYDASANTGALSLTSVRLTVNVAVDVALFWSRALKKKTLLIVV